MEYFSQFDTMIANTVLKRDISCKERILEYVKSIVELYENYPALASIVLNYETLMCYDHTKGITERIIKDRWEFILHNVKVAQNTGEIESYYSPHQLTDVINGIMSIMIQRWKISGYGYQLKNDMLTTIKKVMNRS